MVVVIGLAIAGVLILGLVVARPLLRLASPAVARAAPPSIDGLPRTADLSSQPIDVLGVHVANIASGTYGAGPVRYAVVAVSGLPGGVSFTLAQTLTPTVAGDDTLDQASATHLTRGGTEYTCWRLSGAAKGVSCSWDADGVTGMVVQIGSDDMATCADFGEVARHSLRGG